MENFLKFAFWINVAIFLFCCLYLTVSEINYKKNVDGYLQQAAIASNTQDAAVSLEKAINGLERRGMTEGNTSIFFSTPKNDLAFWYKNLKASHRNLIEINQRGNVDYTEQSVILVKLRETVSLNKPDSIELYPYQILGLVLLISGLSSMILGFIYMINWD